MHISNINDAKTNLSQLIKRALAGDEIIIARANEPLVKLTPMSLDTSPRIGGFWKGQITYSESLKKSDDEIANMFASSNIFPHEGA